VDGALLRTWSGHQINDLALTADGRHLLATPANGQQVRVYALQAGVEREIAAPSAIISISLASDSRHLLVRALIASACLRASELTQCNHTSILAQVHMSNGNISLWELPSDLSQPMPTEPVKSCVRNPLLHAPKAMLHAESTHGILLMQSWVCLL